MKCEQRDDGLCDGEIKARSIFGTPVQCEYHYNNTCKCKSDKSCGGKVKRRSLYMGQLSVPLCDIHFEELSNVRV